MGVSSNPVSGLRVEALAALPAPGWLRLRQALWPEASEAGHLAEMACCVAAPARHAQFVVLTAEDVAVGLAEVSLRSDYVNGTHSSPVAFLEGLYVDPEWRRQGAARRLLQAVRGWALAHGCSELASDTDVSNTLGQAVHAGLGFAETERVVYFCMALVAADSSADGVSALPG